MKIHAMGGHTIGGIESSAPASNAPSSAWPTAGAGAGAAATVSISAEGGLLGELDRLKISDPEKFRARLQDLAERLRTAAGAVGGKDAPALEQLADKMTEAAQTGELAVLRPPALGGRRAA
jgi:hypothetical protein